jgi:hypothetical protein
MPKKSKKTILKQKQKQAQNVKQSVVVKIGEVAKKRKRTYRRKSSGGSAGGSQQLQPQSLPPNVIYQSNQITPVPVQFNPEPVTKITEPAPKPKTIMEDVGVGTEGFVKILELPTKREQLGMMIEPIKTKILPPKKEQPIRILPQKQEQPTLPPKQEQPAPSFIMGPQIPESQMPNLTGNEPIMVSSKEPKILNLEENAEKMERSQMNKEDNASLMLGLSQFNFKPLPRINKNLEAVPLPEIKEPMGVPTFNVADYQPAEKPLSLKFPSAQSTPRTPTPRTPTPKFTGYDEWSRLTKEFNSISNEPPRTVEELYRKIRSKTKVKELIKMQQRATTPK